MLLSDKIFNLRTGLKLSQEELAEKIGVSRQSVSKWETGASVPDLDKLVALSEIFNVTLDEIVKGEILEKIDEPIKNVEYATEYKSQEPKKYTTRKLVGFTLLNVGLIGLLFSITYGLLMLILSLLLIISGIICVNSDKRSVIYVGWTIFAPIMYLTPAFTGLGSVTGIFDPNLYIYGSRIAYFSGIIMAIIFVILLIATVFSFKAKTSKILAFFTCVGIFLVNYIISAISLFMLASRYDEISAEMITRNALISAFSIVYILIIVVLDMIFIKMSKTKA